MLGKIAGTSVHAHAVVGVGDVGLADLLDFRGGYLLFLSRD